jgi:hypothetical protein
MPEIAVSRYQSPIGSALNNKCADHDRAETQPSGEKDAIPEY